MSRIRILAALLATLAASACSDATSTHTTPPPPPPARVTASVDVTPAAHTLVAGESVTLLARALDAAGVEIPGRAVAWTSSNPLVAGVTPAGGVTAVSAGTAIITATIDQKSAVAQLVVSAVPVATIAVMPAAFVLEVGETKQMTAIVKDAQGNVLTGRAVQWSADAAAVSISASGLVTALAPGYVGLTAVSEAKSSSVGATVVAPEPLAYDLLYTKESGANTNEIWVLDFSGTPTPIRINAGSVSRQPSASPDGKRIAFAISQPVFGGVGEQHDIYAVDRTGLNIKWLTRSENFEDSPAWSPDGTRIAYRSATTTSAPMRSYIFVMNADGSGQVNLTADVPPNAFLSTPAWSPDGTRIAYGSSITDGASTRNGIWVMNADGSNKREITSTLTGFDGMPSWSPDGKHIVFVRYFGGEGDLALVELATGTVTRLPVPGLQVRPAWSPDGRFIAFSTQLGPQSALYTIRPNGADLRLRTTSRAWGDAWDAAWIVRP
jgi:hypothetical protein